MPPLSVFDLLDSAGAERLYAVRDAASGLRAFVVLDSTALGPAVGGIRTWRYSDETEALGDAVALARTMTLKCALAGLPCGGGKGVVLDGPWLTDRAAAFGALGAAVDMLGGAFLTGGDLGTSADDLAAMHRRCRFVHDEGPGLDTSGSTARGVVLALSAAVRHAGVADGLGGLETLVQGVGSVGSRVAIQLAKAGARLSVCDVDGSRAARIAAETGARVVSADAALSTRCDAFVPCAKGGVIDAVVARHLPAKVVCGAANNPFADSEAEEILAARGIVVVPDFVASAGGVIEGIGASILRLTDRDPLLMRIADTTRHVLDRAAASGVTTMEAAREMAEQRIAEKRDQRSGSTTST